MHSVGFSQLKIALIGFLTLLSLVACESSQDGTADKETEGNTAESVQLTQGETDSRNTLETGFAIFKPTVPEDDRYYYMIVDSYLVRIGKENQQMELLCFDSDCIHSRTRQCEAYIPRLTEYTVEDRGMVWLAGEELFFVSGIRKTTGSGRNSINVIEKYNLATKERSEVSKLAQMEIYALPNAGWSLSGKNLYYFAETNHYYNGVEDEEYLLCSTNLGPGVDPMPIKVESAGERLEAQNDKIYYIVQGKFYIFFMENGENILVDEDVYDFAVGEDKVFYMKSKAGIYCYEHVTGVRECIYSKYPIEKENAALSYHDGVLAAYFSDGDFLVLSESGEEIEKKKEWMYMPEFGELRQVEGGFLIGSADNSAIWLIKYSADGVQEYSVALQ